MGAEESIFEQIDERMVSQVLHWTALGTLVAGIVIGLLVAKLRKRYPKDFIYGILIGLIGPALCLFWHLYDARTSYWDWLYQKYNPDTYIRVFWIPRGVAPDTDDGSVVMGQYNPKQFWKFVQPYPLWSVYSLLTMLGTTIVAAIVIGLALALFISRVERKWSNTPQSAGVGPPGGQTEGAAGSSGSPPHGNSSGESPTCQRA